MQEDNGAGRIIFRHNLSPDIPQNTYSMHTHNVFELIYFLSGDATHVIEDRKYKLKKGDLVLIRPLQYHFIQIDSPVAYERYNVLFDPEKHGVESVSLIPPELEVINLGANDVAGEIFRKCDLYKKSLSPQHFASLLPHLLSELFYSLSIYSAAPYEQSATLSVLVSGALRYINEHLFSIGEIGEVARALFVSESYLFRRFKAELHQTPKKYIMDKRLLIAQSRIVAGEKPTAVCEACGFDDYTTFYRNYVAFFGHSPSLARAEHAAVKQP